MIKIKEIEIRQVELPLKRSFIVSFGTLTHRNVVLVKLTTFDGNTGWGEAPTINWPVYKPEYPGSVVAVIKDVIAPTILNKEFLNAADLDQALEFIRGNYFAKAAISIAAYDIFAQQNNSNIKELLGGTQESVTISKTISIYEDLGRTLAEAQEYYDEGIRWLKLKIKPAHELKQIEALRDKFPNCQLMIDANSSYRYNDTTLAIFQQIDQLNLFSIEQPLNWDDLVFHAKLQKQLKTPIALDESIDSPDNLEQAIEIGACQAVNIKVARVGGLTSAKRIHDLCALHALPCWTGGMLEAPIGFAANLAFSSLAACVWPIDFMESDFLIENSHAFFDHVPYTIDGDQLTFNFSNSGLGFKPVEDQIRKVTISKLHFK